MKVVVMDNDSNARYTTAQVVELLGYTVIREFASSTEAIQAMPELRKEGQRLCFLLDLDCPNHQDGLDVAEAVERMLCLPLWRIVICTAYAGEWHWRWPRIVKPYDHTELAKLLQLMARTII